MSAITRYVITEFLKVFTVSLAVVGLFVLVYCAAYELQRSGLPPRCLYIVLPYLIPYSVKSALQASVLFATCVVYGRLSAAHEMTALKSMGISPWIVIAPVVWLATGLAILAPLLDDLHASWCLNRMQTSIVENADVVFLHTLKEKGLVTSRAFRLQADHVTDDRLYGVKLHIQDENNHSIDASAEEAYFMRGNSPGDWFITLCRSEIAFDQYKIFCVDAQTVELPMYPKVGRAHNWSRVLEQRQAVAAAKQLLYKSQAQKDCDTSKLRERYESAVATLLRCETQFMHKWANGFCCVGFVLLAAPVAILFRTTSYLGSFFVCFLPVLLLFQPLHKFPTICAESGLIPPYFVWGADAVLGAVGGVLLRIVCRR